MGLKFISGSKKVRNFLVKLVERLGRHVNFLGF